jgi:hypothetical protein
MNGWLEHVQQVNNELRIFLSGAQDFIGGSDTLEPIDLDRIRERIESLAPLVLHTQHSGCTDTSLKQELVEYVQHLEYLQSSLEKMRCTLLARRAQMEAARRHLDTTQAWLAAYRQCT